MAEFGSTPARRLLFRLLPSLLGLFFYACVVLLRRVDFNSYLHLLQAFDNFPNKKPFGDLNAVLQAQSCWQQGVDVYQPNLCMSGGNYNYSPLLLHVSVPWLGPQNITGAGVFLGMAFFAALALLPVPRSRAELMARMLAVGSGTVVHAMECGNIDGGIVIAVIIGITLLPRNSFAAAFGYGLFLLMSALKFYPIILMLLLMRERLTHLLSALAAVGAAGIIYLIYFHSGVSAALQIIPGGPPFTHLFGAKNITNGLCLLAGLPAAGLAVARITIFGTILLGALALRTAVSRAPLYVACVRSLDTQRQLLLTAGGLTIAACFFAAQNLDYRGLYLLLTLPGLVVMYEQSSGTVRRRMLVLIASILFVLSESTFRQFDEILWVAVLPARNAGSAEILYWLLREYVWWRIVTEFMAIITCFLQDALRHRWQEAQAWMNLEPAGNAQ